MNRFISGEIYSYETDGGSISGAIGNHLNVDHVRPLANYVRVVAGVCRFESVMDYYGIRYHLLLKRNTKVVCCQENKVIDSLLRTHCARNADEDIYEAAKSNCLDLFWPVIAMDSASQENKVMKRQTFQELYQVKSTVKIQLSTNEEGNLSRHSHDELRLYPFSDPIKNPCPSYVRVFQREEIEYLQDLKRGHVLKARIRDQIVVVKGVSRRDMLMEVEILMKLPAHPNLVPSLIGVVEAGPGYIDQFVLPFIKGKQLSRISAARTDQKAVWQRQVSEALSVLHIANITWGDVTSKNVMIEDESGKAIVLDFGQGNHEGRTDSAQRLDQSKISDLRRLARLKEEIARLDPL